LAASVAVVSSSVSLTGQVCCCVRCLCWVLVQGTKIGCCGIVDMLRWCCGHCCCHGAVVVTARGEYGVMEGSITRMLALRTTRSMHCGGAKERGSRVVALFVVAAAGEVANRRIGIMVIEILIVDDCCIVCCGVFIISNEREREKGGVTGVACMF